MRERRNKSWHYAVDKNEWDQETSAHHVMPVLVRDPKSPPKGHLIQAINPWSLVPGCCASPCSCPAPQQPQTGHSRARIPIKDQKSWHFSRVDAPTGAPLLVLLTCTRTCSFRERVYCVWYYYVLLCRHSNWIHFHTCRTPTQPTYSITYYLPISPIPLYYSARPTCLSA